MYHKWSTPWPRQHHVHSSNELPHGSPLFQKCTQRHHYLFAISLLALHNPALRCSPEKVTNNKDIMKDQSCRIGLLYLDSTLGGICGNSLTRFHIRMYPDPLRESLTFWNAVYEGTYDYNIKKLCTAFGNPRLCRYNPNHFTKLLKDPNSINVPKGLRVLRTWLKERLR